VGQARDRVHHPWQMKGEPELGRATPAVLQAGEGEVEEGRRPASRGGRSRRRRDLGQETRRRFTDSPATRTSSVLRDKVLKKRECVSE
jgi:hypothetical protein